MTKNFKYFLIGLVFSFLLATFAYAQTTAGSDSSFGLETTADEAKLNTYGSDLPTLIGNILGAVLSFIGVLFFVLMLYGGLLWMTARGKDDQEKKAMDTIMGAVIGVIIVLAAYAITKFVFSSLGAGKAGSGLTSPGIEPPLSICSPASINGCGGENLTATCTKMDGTAGACGFLGDATDPEKCDCL